MSEVEGRQCDSLKEIWKWVRQLLDDFMRIKSKPLYESCLTRGQAPSQTMMMITPQEQARAILHKTSQLVKDRSADMLSYASSFSVLSPRGEVTPRVNQDRIITPKRQQHL